MSRVLASDAAITLGRTETERSVTTSAELARWVFLLGQLGLLAIVIRQFSIDSNAFLRLYLLAAAGFAVHYFLPLRLRMPFFTILSLSGIVVVLGLSAGLTLIGLGAALIALCHLPVSWPSRIAALLVAAALLAGMRVEWLNVPISAAVWPILGAMFMFRLIVYIYDLRHGVRTNVWTSLGYFFMLPNVCFPLFPVIDFKTFTRQYFDRDRFEIYQQGVGWIVRGLVHLVLYRVVYYHLSLSPENIVDSNTLVQFLVSNFLLYLRVSGYFHLIIGMLYLFGFRLPETHYRYLTSASFTDFWRRINIYWKDFMMKIFYYPMYFRLKNRGGTFALVVATAVVFAVTWAAHSYQWFWIRGDFPIVWQDGAFWSILALLVIANSLYEIRYGRKRSLKPSSWSFRESVALGLKTVGTFFVIVVLWSLWTSESFAGWVAMWSVLWDDSPARFPTYFVAVAAAIFCGALLAGRSLKGGDARSAKVINVLGVPLTWATLRTVGTLLVLALAGLPQVYTQFGTAGANFVLSLRQGGLSRADAEALQRGYYEELSRVNRFNSQLWEIYMERPLGWLDPSMGVTQFTGDFLGTELRPAASFATDYGLVTINRWGMRDQNYEALPPEGAYRIAILGASSVMGFGVGSDDVFETVLERRLNEAAGLPPFELLNFAVPGYYPLQMGAMLDRALGFAPHAVMYVATGRELSRAAYYLAQLATEGTEIPYPELQAIVDEAGVDRSMSLADALRRLAPFQEPILTWVYERVATQSRAQNATPMLVFLPQTVNGSWQEETPPTLALADSVGLLVLDLNGVYDGVDASELILASWDEHPNAAAHERVAARLFDLIVAHWSTLQQTAGARAPAR